MNRQESFEQHYADQHDLPVSTMAQYRFTTADGYRLPKIAAAYRDYCAGWDAARAVTVELTITPLSEERIREQVARVIDPMTIQGPRYE